MGTEAFRLVLEWLDAGGDDQTSHWDFACHCAPGPFRWSPPRSDVLGRLHLITGVNPTRNGALFGLQEQHVMDWGSTAWQRPLPHPRADEAAAVVRDFLASGAVRWHYIVGRLRDGN